MSCKYFETNSDGQPMCNNGNLTEVKYCPFEFTMKKKAPQCCTGYTKGKRKALRCDSSDQMIQSIAHAAWVALPFNDDTIIVTFENANGDSIKCEMSPTDDGDWKLHKIQTDVDGEHVSGKFRRAVKRSLN